MSGLRQMIAADRRANRGNPKGRSVLFWFRIASALRARRDPVSRLAYIAVAAAYKSISEGILGIELPPSTRIGPGLRLFHGVGLVVNPGTQIGANVTLRHSVTIGNRGDSDDCPIIEDGVEIGAGAVIIGGIRVGAGSRIGPLSLVTKDVPRNALVRPAPATITTREE